MGGLLSSQQFSKYKKLQYNINVVPIHYRQNMKKSGVAEPYRNKVLLIL
jgi:hypothetical protein